MVLALLLGSRPPKRSVPAASACVGIALSFAAPWFMQPPIGKAPAAVSAAILATSLFYFGLMVWSYAALGRNLGVIPSIKALSLHGPYRLLRHPIYASHILLAATLLVARTTPANALALTLLVTGILLRVAEEEKLLMTETAYRAYAESAPSRLMAPTLLVPLAAAILLKSAFALRGPRPPERLRVQTSFPVLSLHPLVYDDWASVFVGNHIYPRLLSEPGREWIPPAAHEALYECVEPGASQLSPCRKERLLLKLREFVSCAGRPITRAMIAGEISRTLDSKNWILPGHARCSRAGYDVCLEYGGIPDAGRRLQNVYFRFGWSVQDFSADSIGVAPYCFRVEKRAGDAIEAGSLIPRDAKSGLPRIDLFTSSRAEDDFDISLFGSPDRLGARRRNIDLITPVAYYVVSNPLERRRPWNSPAVRTALREHLERFDLVYRTDTLLTQWMPEGAARAASEDGSRVEFALPDYLPDCGRLARRLNETSPAIAAVCENTTSYIEDRIRANKKPWHGFLTPLSPGAPGRTSVVDQYFSSISRESWLRGAKNPAEHFYRVGLGKSLITIDQRLVCAITGNPMGQSDLVVSDFEYCR